MQTGLLWFLYNCLNIIPWKNIYSYHCFVLAPSSKISYHGLRWESSGWVCWLSTKSCVQPPAPKRKATTRGRADSFLGPGFYLADHLYASFMFLSILLCSKFWESQAWVLQLRSLSDSFSYSHVRFPNGPQCAGTWSGHSDGSPVEYAEWSKARSPYRPSSDPQT